MENNNPSGQQTSKEQASQATVVYKSLKENNRLTFNQFHQVLPSVWLDLTRTVAGCSFDHEADSATVLSQLVSDALTADLRAKYVTYLHWAFYPGEDVLIRVARLMISISKILRRDPDMSIVSIDSELQEDDIFKGEDGDNIVDKQCREMLVFVTIGWITNLYIPKLTTDGTFAVDTEGATGFHTSFVSRDLASRSLVETIREFGDILPTRQLYSGEGDYERSPMLAVPGEGDDMLHIASMNIASLQRVGHIKIEWTGSLAGHLDFEPAHLNHVSGNITAILKLFRYPSLCYQFSPGSSLLHRSVTLLPPQPPHLPYL
jgi:hypothetical protein